MVGMTIASVGLAFSPNIIVFGVLRILIGMCGPGIVDMGALICMLFKCIFVSLPLYIHPTALTYRISLSPAPNLTLSFFRFKGFFFSKHMSNSLVFTIIIEYIFVLDNQITKHSPFFVYNDIVVHSI